MPSTYTTSGLELIGDGEQDGSWGSTTNSNFQLFDRMISQAGAISLTGTTHTLTISDGTLSDGHYAVLVFGGSPSGTNTVTISPNDAQRFYLVKNASGQSVVLTQGSGGNVTVANGGIALVYCDGAGSGAEVVNVTPTLDSLGVTASVSELNKLDGVTWTLANYNALTSTAAELNLLDGVTWTLTDYNALTATAAELNILDGATVTVTEVNYLSGVSSAIQTQLDGKQALDATLTALAGLSTGANKIPYSTGTDTFAQLDFIDDDTMATATATNVSSAEAAKAYVDAEVAAAIPASYTDATGQTLDGTQLFTWTHGLGSTPETLSVWIECLVADKGFSVGDVVFIPASFEGNGARGTTVWANSTQVGVSFGGYPYITTKTGGGVALITTNSWRVHVRATL